MLDLMITMQTTVPTPVIGVGIAQLLIFCYIGANLQHFPRAIHGLYCLFAVLGAGIGAWDHFKRQGTPRQANPDRVSCLFSILMMGIPTYQIITGPPGFQGWSERFRYAIGACCICSMLATSAWLVGICLSDVSQYYHRNHTPVVNDIETQEK